MKQNQSSTSTKPNRPNVASSRMQKGSEDPIKQHNRFGPLEDDGAIDTDENTRSQGAHISRPRSPIKAPKY